MDVEEEDVEHHRDGNQAESPGQEVLHRVGDGLRQVSQNDPELLYSISAHQEDHEEPDKLDREGAAQHGPGEAEPGPPLDREGPLVEGPELEHAVGGPGDEEEQDGVEQDVLVQGQHTHV